ncbi:MAG: ABC transporter permease [Deltaproteobacteria bacterium]|nr:ABC transporter permease [Deltaproteobacteria bacterium]
MVRLVREKPLGAFGGVLVLLVIVAAALAGVISPYPRDEMHIIDKLQPPSAKYLMGTDHFGRDLFTRILYGAQTSIIVGFGVVLFGTTTATVMSLVSGYFGGLFDTLFQRIVDAVMALPGLVLLLTIMSILGPGLPNVILALSLTGAFTQSRTIRSAVLSTKENQYIDAARAMGAGSIRILLVHILPNVFAPIIIIATAALGAAILAEASLSFLGFGVVEPIPSWGRMLSQDARFFMVEAPWMAIFPGIALSMAIFGFNMLGDGLRDVLDPRLRGGGGRIR